MERTTIVKEREKNAACFYAARYEAPDDFSAFRLCATAFFLCGHCLTSWKACKQVIPKCWFGVDYVVLSSAVFRGRPPFLPASEAICRRRSGESFSARALPPMRANSVTVSG